MLPFLKESCNVLFYTSLEKNPRTHPWHLYKSFANFSRDQVEIIVFMNIVSQMMTKEHKKINIASIHMQVFKKTKNEVWFHFDPFKWPKTNLNPGRLTY